MRLRILSSITAVILGPLLLLSCDEQATTPELKTASDTAELLTRWRAMSPEEATTLRGLEFIERWCELDLDTLDQALNEIDDTVVWCNFVQEMKEFHLENPDVFIDLAKQIDKEIFREMSVGSVFFSIARKKPQQAFDLVLNKLEPGPLRRQNLRFVSVVALTDDVESVRTALAVYKNLESRDDRSSFEVALNSVETVEQRDMIIEHANEMGIREADLAAFEKRLAKVGVR